MLEHLLTLGMLTLLQAVLGFDNLLYISLESRRAPQEKQAMVRTVGIILAMVLRIVLLFLLLKLVHYVQDPFFHPNIPGVIEAHVNLYAVIVLVGGVFMIYTATKEILHIMNLEEVHGAEPKARSSVAKTIAMIALMNVVISFDSILSAMALTDVMWIMASAIVIGGVLMIVMADHVSAFIQKNRMYEVLGLFILFVVGIMLLTEGGHLAHLKLMGSPITPMTKTTFYFVISILILTDIVQTRYQKQLMAAKKALHRGSAV
jgi:predicted tellurium resistance membrane protein TerC